MAGIVAPPVLAGNTDNMPGRVRTFGGLLLETRDSSERGGRCVRVRRVRCCTWHRSSAYAPSLAAAQRSAK